MDNLATYFGQFAPELLKTSYGKEIWALYETGKLLPESALTGIFMPPQPKTKPAGRARRRWKRVCRAQNASDR